MLLVTGMTGHTGKYFLDELVRNRYEGSIRAVVRKTSDTSALDSSGLRIEKLVGDLGDQPFMNDALRGANSVMHIASIFHSNTVVRAAVRNAVRWAILVHTTGIYSRYKSASEEYRRIEAEVARTTAGTVTNVTYLRPTMIYGDINDLNMSRFIAMVSRFRVIPVIDHGSSLIQPVNARDLGRAYYQVLSQTGIKTGDYVLSGDRPITLLHALRLISSNLGRSTTFVSVPLGVGALLARLVRLGSLGKVDYVEKVQRMGEDRSFPHDAAARDFGYRPMTFEDGIRIEVGQYLERVRAEGGQ